MNLQVHINVWGELIGTALLILLGCGVVANVVLNKTKGNGGGWIVITFGWAMAVFVGVFASTKLGGSGYLNPAVTLAMATIGEIDVTFVGPYVLAQFCGALLGASLAWLIYKSHFDETENQDLKLAVFATGPAIRKPFINLVTEFIGTFVLMFGALSMSKSAYSLGTLDALPVGLLVLAIGLSLGGSTGYAINPVRDFGPRIAHTLLPIKNKRDSDWGYAWIPIVGPVLGALAGAWVFKLLYQPI